MNLLYINSKTCFWFSDRFSYPDFGVFGVFSYFFLFFCIWRICHAYLDFQRTFEYSNFREAYFGHFFFAVHCIFTLDGLFYFRKKLILDTFIFLIWWNKLDTDFLQDFYISKFFTQMFFNVFSSSIFRKNGNKIIYSCKVAWF